jgi:hypothetical protein
MFLSVSSVFISGEIAFWGQTCLAGLRKRSHAGLMAVQFAYLDPSLRDDVCLKARDSQANR